MSAQIDVWWLHASVHRVEQVNIEPAGIGTGHPRGSGGRIYVRETTGGLRVTGTDGQPLCSDGPNRGAFYRC